MNRRTTTWSVALSSIPFALFVGLLAEQRGQSAIDVENFFSASGFMGDGEYGRKYIDLSGSDRTGPHSRPTAIRITYTFGPTRWAGVYWQNEPDNWGDKPGVNYSGRGFTRLTFWAKGDLGNEVVEFKSGGIDNRVKKFRDSFAATTGRVNLSKDWRQYRIDLSKANLSSVIGAFCWVASADYNTDGRITFYLDDMYLE